MAKFVHLHLHTEYSLLDGLSKISDLVTHLKENSMDTCAITDHGAMHGVIEFYKKCLKEQIKPIIGMEAYTTNVDHRERPERSKVKNYHLLLLAKNEIGYKNLMKLTTIAHLEGYYYRPRVDRETLTKYKEGIIATSACAQGELAQALIAEEFDKAKQVATWFSEVFGKDYYLELQRHEYTSFVKEAANSEIKNELALMAKNEKKIEEGVLAISRELGIPVVATNDAHYIKKKDATAQDALLCIATGKNVSDIKRLRFIDATTFYVRSPSEMGELFGDIPDAISNTKKVADLCDLTLTLDKWFFPKYELPDGTADTYLTKLAKAGLVGRLGKVSKEANDRLEYELSVIKQKGYATYFLIVADLARWVNENGIFTNTRGSTAGSLVAYALGIVNINPLDYNLPFERMLTPWRPSPPDIDFDIADDRREEVISYLVEKYGKERVAQICTFGRMLARGAVRDVARVLGYSYSVGDKIAKLIPMGSQGFPMSIEKALSISNELKTLYKSDPDSKKIMDLGREIEGNARHVSVHAAGVVIAPTEITDFTPLSLDPEGRKIITQYDMDAIDPNVSPNEAVGLLKFDILGLRNLSILELSIKIVREERDIDIDIHKIPIDDAKTFEMLSRGETMGVFQLSGSGMTRYLKELRPTRVEDLMAMVALYRPGPMAKIPEYIARKNSPDKIIYFDPRMKDYLDKSYGLLVYQDDVFLSAINIAGYSWEEADKFRKAVAKKIPAEMERQRIKFIEGCVKGGMTRAKAEELFALIEPFSGYGFNKAHAASYGMVAYQTAYMKANYPIEFMCAYLTCESQDAERISQAVYECRRMGITVLGPDINESKVDFTIVSAEDSLGGKRIRFGLSAIKNVGVASIAAILSERDKSKFESFADFIGRVDARRVNKKVLESLIKVGGLSLFGGRATLLASLEKIRGLVTKPKSLPGQRGLFHEETGIKVQSRDFSFEVVPEFEDTELQNLERALLGFSFSAKPVLEVLSPIASQATHKISELSSEDKVGTRVKIAAVIKSVRIVVTKKTNMEMAFVKVEDETGSCELVVFPKLFARSCDLWVESSVILVSGSVEYRDEAYSILADDVTRPNINSDDTVFITVPADASSEQLKSLKELLVRNPGEKKVVLVFAGADQTMNLPYTIGWNESFAHLIAETLEKDSFPRVQ